MLDFARLMTYNLIVGVVTKIIIFVTTPII